MKFWTGFGASVTGALNPLFARFEQENPDIKVLYESKGGYPNLQQAINGSISTNTYPHIANGYPDHLVGYINANILVNLGNPLTTSITQTMVLILMNTIATTWPKLMAYQTLQHSAYRLINQRK